MLTAQIQHSRDGYRLEVSEAHSWALAVEDAVESFCALLGHPFCRGVWPIGHRLGQLILTPAPRQPRWSTALTYDQVAKVFPEAAFSDLE